MLKIIIVLGNFNNIKIQHIQKSINTLIENTSFLFQTFVKIIINL